jgi:hypothetical protein
VKFMESEYEKQILDDIRSLPPNLLPKISKLIRFFKDEILSESEKHPIKNKTFASLDGIFQGQIEHTDEDIRAVQIKLKEI